MFVRSTTAFDHNVDGELSLEPFGDGWYETGTFLKSIALLPMLETTGFNTIHLLPITSIGEDGHKGNLGSCYAIRNPYEIDERLTEPAVGLSAAELFEAFVEAAHRMGIRVVVEFIFRTASLDSDWAAEHPEWFYWIRADVPDRGAEDEEGYGAPRFSEEELERAFRMVENGEREGLPEPPESFRELFTPPPPAESVRKENGRWIGELADGTRVRIPGAFADWPPDDPQPPWTDVTYLRLFDHPDFNYIAYNTVRMYDRRLAKPENRIGSLWERIVEILPFYEDQFDIDGAMIDMGHALPTDLKRRVIGAARHKKPDFAFWDENFGYTPGIVEEGYDAIIGNYWWMFWRPEKLIDDFLRSLAEEGFPLPFFAAPESHNTPRAADRPGGIAGARLAWALGCLLPAIPFCHSGLELAELVPVNTGLDFEPEEIASYSQDELALFSAVAYDWLGERHLVDWVRRTLAIRESYKDLIVDGHPSTVEVLRTDNEHVWGVIRRRDSWAIGCLANFDISGSEQTFSVRLSSDAESISDFLTGERWELIEGVLKASLPRAGCLLFEL